MKPLPIRVRLTFWYSVMFATAALLLSLASWAMLRYSLSATLHQDFEERVDDVRTELHLFSLAPSAKSSQARFDSIYRFRDDGKWLQILDENGHWIYRSQRMAAEDATLAVPGALRTHGAAEAAFQQGTRHVRTMSKVINVDGHAYSVEVGAALNKQEALLRTFGIELLILTPLVLFAAVLAGHSMSRKALEPVMLIALEARRISDRNLELRLPVSPTQDEISHLSITLNNMLARIDAGYRSVKDFTANASHELRTPLARIRTEAEVALLTPRSTLEYQEALANMQGSAEEMTRLTENLLALARADAESSTLTLEPVDLWELIEAECVEWNGVCQHLHRSLRTECVGTEPNAATSASVVLGDRASLMRLTRILLDNAVKFTPAGGSIVVAVEVAGDVAILSVEDSGIGIAPEEQPRIFERFYRVRGDRAEGNSGSGLGLSLAAWIAEQHGSCISLKSAVGCGSRFSLALRRVAHGTAPQDTGRRVGTSLVAEVSVPRR